MTPSSISATSVYRDRPSPSFTAFIAFDSSVGAEVYVRRYQYVDEVVLAETH